VERPVADVKSIEIVPTETRRRSIFPAGQVAKAFVDSGPIGKGGAAPFALDILIDTSCIRILLPHTKEVFVEIPGDGEPHGPSANGNGLRPGGHVGTVVDGEAVAIGTGRHAIELDEVDAPRGEERYDGVHVLLRSGFGE